MDTDPFDRQIEDFQTKILEILDPSSQESIDANEKLEKLQATISVMLEELQVASEELRLQNEQLYNTQILAEQERERYQNLFEYAPDAYLVTDHLGIIAEANQAAVKMLNVPSTQVEGKPLATFFRGDALQDLFNHLRFLSQKNEQDEWEMQLLPRKLPPIIVRIRAAVQNTEPHQPQRVLWLIRDVTERRRIERGLHESQARFTAIFEAADMGIALLDLQGKFLVSNPVFQHLLGYTERDLQQYQYPQLITSDTSSEECRLFSALRVGDSNRYDIEHPAQRKNGETIWIRNIMTLLRDAPGNPQFILGLFEDITFLHERDEEIIQLERHIAASAENERESLSRDLHDGPLQHQIGIMFQIKQLIDSTNDPALVSELELVYEEVQQVVNMLRMTSGLLRSPTLAHFGLDTAVRAYVEQVQAHSPDIKIVAEINHPDWTLSGRVQQGVYRILQHCLTNTLHHSNASEITVQLSRTDEHLTLEIQDNGDGFEVPRRWIDLTRGGHYGLIGSAERAAALGGILQIHSRPYEGTLVRVKVPLKEEEQKKHSLADLDPEIPVF